MKTTLMIPSFPAYPTNGGRIEVAPPKVGKWTYEPKIDDWHGVVHVPTGFIWNQYGEPSSITSKFTAALLCLQVRKYVRDFEWLDVGLMNNRHDMMRGCIVIFDFIPTGTARPPYMGRRKLLEAHFDILPMATELLFQPTLRLGASQKRQFGSAIKPVHDRVFLINRFTPKSPNELLTPYKALQAENKILGHKFYEGLVAKRTDKPYPLQLRKPKEPTPWMMKHRFDQT